MPIAQNPITGEMLELVGDQWMPLGVDKETGAPAGVRAVVGPEHRGPDDRLATLRKFYPDAQMFGDGNFVFTENGKARLYNPSGIDVGDLAEYGRIIPEMLGGAAGGVLGAMASTPTGMTSAPVMVPVGVGLGAETAGQAYDAALENLIGRVDTRGAGRRAVDAATGVTANAAGQKVVPTIAEGAKKLVGAARNRLAGEAPEVVMRSFQRANIPIEGAGSYINASRPVQGLQNALTMLPTSARTMGDAIDTTLQAMGRYADDVAHMAGTPGTLQQTGEIVKEGAKSAGKRLSNRMDTLQRRVWDAVGKDTMVPIQNVRSLVETLQGELSRAPESLSYLKPAIAEGKKLIADAGEAGSVPFDVLRKFRTHVGKLTERPDISGYVGGASGQVNRLYGALSDDLNAAADAAGGGARQSLDLFNRYARIQLSGNKPFLDKIDAKFPEEIIGNLISGGKRGATQIRQLRNNLLPNEWDDVAATVIHRMGQATPGAQTAAGDAFSPATFLTNWNRMSQEARQALFGGKRYAELRPALDRLARISASAKDAAKMANASGTGQTNFYMNIAQGSLPVMGYAAGGVEGAAVGMAASYGGPYGLAKLMTNPKFVRWLSRGMQIEPTNYGSMAAHLGRLSLVAKTEGDIKGEIRQFLESMRAVLPQPPADANDQESPRTE